LSPSGPGLEGSAGAETARGSVSADPTRGSYDLWHDRHEVDREADAPWHRLVLRHLDRTRDLDGKRVLEVACGRGGFAVRLMRTPPRAARLVGADFSAGAVMKARGFAESQRVGGISWEVCDAQTLSHPDGSFDTVISCETIEHLPSPTRAVSEFARVLRPGGRLILTTPNYLGGMGLYRAWLRLAGRRYTEEGQPVNRLTLLPLTLAWIVRTGLRPVRVEAAGHYLPWPRRRPIELRWPERLRPLRWFALHSLVIAEKPAQRTP
jgi:SAM-dependent methyltransferase